MRSDRVVLVGVSGEGLLFAQHNTQWKAPWATIESVAAGKVPHARNSTLMLAFGLDNGRVIMVGELEPVWSSLTVVLASQLPGMEPFTSWAPRLAVAADAELLYERSNGTALQH